MDPLIQAVNSIHDVASKAKISAPALPQVVVIGTQSSGKSSVLESFVKRPFLPRGKNIVTRCPLVVQMIQTKREYRIQQELNETEQGASQPTDVYDEWVEFLHAPKKQYTNFEEVKKEIEAQMDVLAGRNKGIQNKPITIKGYSPNVVDLTVIDLPGFTKNPVGDQEPDIEQRVNDLVLDYIRRENTIILAVTPATADIATSESLKMAKAVDETGSRTLAVITMLDVPDDVESLVDALSGRILNVQLGIIGVANRSHKDVQSGKSIEEVRHDEEALLRRRFPSIAQFHGTQKLRNRLQELLINNIKSNLNDIGAAINNMIADLEIKFHELGSGGLEVENPRRVVSEVINAYCKAMTSEIFGSPRNTRSDRCAFKDDLIHLYSNTFRRELDKVDPVAAISDEKILTAVSRGAALETIFFSPEGGFRTLIREPIELLKYPSLRCVSFTNQKMKEMIDACAEDLKKSQHNYPKLIDSIVEVSTKFLEKQIENVKQNILTYVFIHVDSTFTTDQLFLDDTQMSRANMDATAPFVSDGVSNVLNGIVSEAVNTISGVANNAVSGAVKGAVNGALMGAVGGGITGAASGALSGALAGATNAAVAGVTNNQAASTGNVNWPAVGATSGPSVPMAEAVVNESPNTTQDVQARKVVNSEISAGNTEAQQRKCEIVRRLMTLYFNSVRKAQDYIPKALISTVVYHVVENLSIELTANIGNEKELTDPTEDAVQRREELKEHLASLNAVAKKIPKLRAL